VAHAVKDPHLDSKLRAAVGAVDHVESGMVVGLGSGSTAQLAIEEIGRRLARGELRNVRGVATSRASRREALLSGVPLTTLERAARIDLTIDGADEVAPDGTVLKGAGGALLWEKIVASSSHVLVIVVDETKLVERIGERHALPIEVVPFGWSTHLEAIRALGSEPALRVNTSGAAYRTDEGHFIIDAHFPGGISDPAQIEGTLCARPGVVETGLFVGYGPTIIVGDADAQQKRTP
jgi:ribose 5-phosphate isomerase A